MYVDVIKATSTDVTSSATIQYLQLNTTLKARELIEAAVNGDAGFGAKTGMHKQTRQRFTAWYKFTSGDRGRWWTWNDLAFVESNTGGEWIIRLQHDRHLVPSQWYQGSSHTNSFGTGGGQLDLTGISLEDIEVRQSSLCTHEDVERLLMSGLQSRMRFDDAVASNSTSNAVMSYDDLYTLIYMKSAMMQSRLNKWYETPLLLGDVGDAYMLAEITAKAVVLDLMRSYLPTATGAQDKLLEWIKEVDEFGMHPPSLVGSEVRAGGGSIRVERA